MQRDKAKEGSCRLGTLLQVYIGPKMFQALDGTVKKLPGTDAEISNEAMQILDKTLPALGIRSQLPLITTESASLDALDQGPLRLLPSLITRIEPRLEDLQGPGPAIYAYRFSWNAAYYLQIGKYAPHHKHYTEATRKTLLDLAPLLGLAEGPVREFLDDPKGKWGATFDLVTAKQKRTFIERLEPKEPKYPLDGKAADDVIRRWLAGM